MHVRVSFSEELGPIKPLHGVGQPPESILTVLAEI